MTPEQVGIDILRECIHFDRGSCTSCAKKAVRAAVQAERERIIKLACEHCRAGHPMSMKHPMTYHDVPIPRRSRGYMMASCKAEEIRSRSAQDEGESG